MEVEEEFSVGGISLLLVSAVELKEDRFSSSEEDGSFPESPVNSAISSWKEPNIS